MLALAGSRALTCSLYKVQDMCQWLKMAISARAICQVDVFCVKLSIRGDKLYIFGIPICWDKQSS